MDKQILTFYVHRGASICRFLNFGTRYSVAVPVILLRNKLTPIDDSYEEILKMFI